MSKSRAKSSEKTSSNTTVQTRDTPTDTHLNENSTMSVSQSAARASNKGAHRNIVQTVYLWRDPKDLIFEDDIEEVVPIAEGVVNKALNSSNANVEALSYTSSPLVNNQSEVQATVQHNESELNVTKGRVSQSNEVKPL